MCTKDNGKSPYTISNEDVYESMLSSDTIAIDYAKELNQSEREENTLKYKQRDPVCTLYQRDVKIGSIKCANQAAMNTGGPVRVIHCGVVYEISEADFRTDVIITPISARKMMHNVQRTTLRLLYNT